MLQLNEVSSIYDEINSRPYGERQWEVAMTIVANSQRIAVTNVLSRETICDFEKNTGDEDYIKFQIGAATYKNYISPYIDDITVELEYTLLDYKGRYISGSKAETYYYRGYLLNPPSIEINKTGSRLDTDQIEEVSGLLDLHMQLLDYKLAEMRMVDVSGIYKDVSMSDLVSSLLCYDLDETATASTLSADDYSGIRGIDIVTPQNTKSYSNIIIPTGTRLTSLVKRLQKDKGLYNCGCNRYYRNGYWYVYPPYNLNRFNDTSKRVNFINIPPDEMVAPEKSFMVVSNEVYVLATGNSYLENLSEHAYLNIGNGIRYARSEYLMDGMVNTTGNKSTPDTSTTNRAMAVEEKPTGLNNARYSKRGVTDNPYVELSAIAKGLCRFAKVNWANADPNKLYPGMPACLWTENRDGIVKQYGTVVGMRSTTAPNTAAYGDNVYLTNTSVVLALEK